MNSPKIDLSPVAKYTKEAAIKAAEQLAQGETDGWIYQPAPTPNVGEFAIVVIDEHGAFVDFWREG